MDSNKNLVLANKNGLFANLLSNPDFAAQSALPVFVPAPEIFEAVEAFSEFNYRYIYRSEILNGYTRYFTRLLHLIADYLEDLYQSYHLDENGYMAEHNMLAAGFYNHAQQMYPKYMEHEGSDKRMIMDYIAGMTDNFCLDCANEILKPDHLNEEIEHSATGRWFDAI